MKVFLKGIGFDKLDAEKAADKVVSLINAGRSGYVVTPNTEILARARNKAFLGALLGADVVLCDGIGVSILALMRGKILHRATGIEFSEKILKKAAEFKIPIFLYGAKENVVLSACENIERIYQGIEIVGVCDGFVSEDIAVNMIRKSGANIVFVCTSSPKQEFFAQKAAKISAQNGEYRMFLALGGVLDIYSGNKARAPKIFQRLGLEWAYRFASEPIRIKRFFKTLIGN